ncbi:hemerythrin domain-containing protein [Pedococcus sp.]|jgi:hypothetical protein|uniref:hemerythrin domain-containing protein n=1 Tax=Pedococcus sp. TaxID=2860345 RepID=UPI002E0ECE81|nr:hemerythrin domain-containing protein [Pedococcus sp.]
MADIIDLIFEDHHWFRQRFFYLDSATGEAELRAVWEPLAARLETHADAEEAIFYPALLKRGDSGDPKEETEDAIHDHNEIRDAVKAARAEAVGTPGWFAAVGEARKQNGQHMDEEEREGLPDFIKSATGQLRHDLAMQWLQFYYEHPAGRGVDETDKDPEAYIRDHD